MGGNNSREIQNRPQAPLFSSSSTSTRRGFNGNEPIKVKEKISDRFESLGVSTVAIIADRGIEKASDVAPPIHLSSTYEVPNEDGMAYSRSNQMTKKRLEKVLGVLESGGIDDNSSARALVYSSGIASVHAVLHAINPKRVAVTRGYGGTLSALRHHVELTGMKIVDFEEELEGNILEAGDLYFVETPSNPCCILIDIEAISKRCKEKNIKMVVDSTFASPILQNPLDLGADIVMHSCTKFLGGHSDLLGGVLATKDIAIYMKLVGQSVNIGSCMGSLECWLLLRSLKTLKIRMSKQCRSATKIALFLSTHKRVTKVWHPSLESHPSYELCKKQMRLPPACFSFEVANADLALKLCDLTRIFLHATSLGGVESLIDYRYKYDTKVSPSLLRISVGLESSKDLIRDLDQALELMGELQ